MKYWIFAFTLCLAFSAHSNEGSRNANINLFHLEYELDKSGTCFIIKGQQQRAYILHQVAPELRDIFEDDFDPFAFEKYHFCAKSNSSEFRQLVDRLYKLGVLKFRTNVTMTNLGYQIERGLRRIEIKKYQKYFYIETEYTYDDQPRSGNLGKYIRGHYREMDIKAHWDSMNLYWHLMETFEEFSEPLTIQ